MNQSLETPILFLIFNRPDTTERVFAEIKKAKPWKLFIASDGARENRDGEKELVEKTRKIVLDNIDWKCEVETLFRDENLGCKVAVSSAIDWFFERVEAGIILEDDCLPDPSFFGFCQELLEKYKDDERIMMISGDNFQDGIKRGDGSYYFSKITYIWGWATWKRAWEKYDVDMKTFPKFEKENQIVNILSGKINQKIWLSRFRKVFEHKLDTWDYQWMYIIWIHSGFGIVPNVNLISNIGFRDDATHTIRANKYANMNRDELKKIIHPTFIIQEKSADEYFFKKEFTHVFLLKEIIFRGVKFFLDKIR